MALEVLEIKKTYSAELADLFNYSGLTIQGLKSLFCSSNNL